MLKKAFFRTDVVRFSLNFLNLGRYYPAYGVFLRQKKVTLR